MHAHPDRSVGRVGWKLTGLLPTDRPDAKLNVYVPVGMGCSPVPSTVAGAADADGDEFQYCAAHAVAGLLADGRLCAAVRSASDSFGRIGFDVLATVIRRQSRYDLARVAGLSGSHADRWTSLVGRSTGRFMAEVVFSRRGRRGCRPRRRGGL